jgi:hypothetical protein
MELASSGISSSSGYDRRIHSFSVREEAVLDIRGRRPTDTYYLTSRDCNVGESIAAVM